MLRRFLIARNGNRRENGHSFTIISAVQRQCFSMREIKIVRERVLS